MIGRKVALAVEGGQWIIWISSPHLHSIVAQFIDMVAYRLFQIFQPLPVHLDMESRISRVLRQGYLARNFLQRF